MDKSLSAPVLVPKAIKSSLLAVENIVKTPSQKPRQRPNMIQPEEEEVKSIPTPKQEEELNEEDYLFITQFKKRKAEPIQVESIVESASERYQYFAITVTRFEGKERFG
jgi:hypothetical protein